MEVSSSTSFTEVKNISHFDCFTVIVFHFLAIKKGKEMKKKHSWFEAYQPLALIFPGLFKYMHLVIKINKYPYRLIQ